MKRTAQLFLVGSLLTLVYAAAQVVLRGRVTISGRTAISVLASPFTTPAYYNVQDYGAVCNGSTDDKPAFDAAIDAIKAVGGGTLKVPACTNPYIYAATNNFVDSTSFTREASNIIIQGDGAQSRVRFTGSSGVKGLILGLPRADINRYCTSPPSTGCSAPAWGLPTYYPIDNATTGGKSVTTTTHGNASNFAAGNYVFIESGDASPTTGHPPAHWEYNKVVSVNGTSGVVTLLYDLSDKYDSTNASYAALMAVVSTVPHNIVVQDMAFESAVNDAILLSPVGTWDTVIERCTFESLSGGHGNAFNSLAWRSRVSNNIFIGMDMDLGDNARFFEFGPGNKFLLSPQGWSATGAVKDYNIHDNFFSTESTSGDTYWAMKIGGYAGESQASNIFVENNVIQLSGTAQYAGCVQALAMDASKISGNKCVGIGHATDQTGIKIGESAINNVLIQGNFFNSTFAANGVQLRSLTGYTLTKIVVKDNYFQIPGVGIFIDPSAGGTITGTKVGCNIHVGNSTDVVNNGTSTSTQTGCP